jgi:DNA-binding CsgD family transcriptional regulator
MDETRLSPRHQECLRLLADGLTSPMIARRLRISPYTVDKYFAALCRRLAVKRRAQALALAIRRNLI